MRKTALQCYQWMMAEIQVCREGSGDKEKEIETCFEIASNYWNDLKAQVEDYAFASEAEEIDFFKNIKPMFTTEIKFYNLLYHALLFKPSVDPPEIEYFWSRELLRLERFRDANKDFCRYVETGGEDKDEIYFLRKEHETGGTAHEELAREAATDELLAEFRALQRYTDYIKLQIEKIKA